MALPMLAAPAAPPDSHQSSRRPSSSSSSDQKDAFVQPAPPATLPDDAPLSMLVDDEGGRGVKTGHSGGAEDDERPSKCVLSQERQPEWIPVLQLLQVMEEDAFRHWQKFRLAVSFFFTMMRRNMNGSLTGNLQFQMRRRMPSHGKMICVSRESCKILSNSCGMIPSMEVSLS